MRRSSLITVIVIVLVVAAGVAYALTRSSSDKNTNSTPSSSSSSQSQNSTPPASSSNSAGSVAVNYDSNGFNPATATVKSGGTVTFTNKSSDQIQIDSDPHPQHTDNTELNIGPLPVGQSKTVTLTTKGTWGIHNHLDPSMKGTIKVE